MSRETNWISLQQEGGLAVLTLNRPQEGNALNGQIFDLLSEQIARLSSSSECRVLLLRAEGPDFCIGRERPSGPPPKPPTAGDFRAEFNKIQRTNETLMAFPGISIAAIQGRALGAGASLAGRCDIALAADDARLGFPEIKSGLAPTIVMSYYAKVLPRKAFFELIVTGREMSAEEARQIGLVTRVVPSDRLQAEARALASELLKHDAEALRTCKAFFRRLERVPMEDAADYGINVLANMLASR